MKSLRYLAVLPLMAAASQALTLDIQLGTANLSAPISGGTDADSSSVVGIGIGTFVSPSSHIGLNFSTRDIENSAALVNTAARSAIFEYTYELNADGGIKPFIGAGLGFAWLTNTVSSTALASNVFAGLRFEISQAVDLTLMARLHQIYNVDFGAAASAQNRRVNSFEGIAGLRFKF